MKKTPQPDIETLLAGVPGDEFLVFAKEYFGSHSEMRAAFRKWFLSVDYGWRYKGNTLF